MILMVIVLVLFGAKRIPEISGSFGKGIREFKRNLADVEGSIADAGMTRPVSNRSPAGEVTARLINDDADVRAEPKRLL